MEDRMLIENFEVFKEGADLELKLSSTFRALGI